MAAQYGTAIFRTALGSLPVDIYFDDTATNPVRWDGGSGASATSPTFYQSPPGGSVLTDVVLAAATGQTKTQVNRNNMSTGVILRNSVHLASITTRPALAIPFPAGSQITMTQLA